MTVWTGEEAVERLWRRACRNGFCPRGIDPFEIKSVEKVVNTLERHTLRITPRAVAVFAPPGSGKNVLLALVGEALHRLGRKIAYTVSWNREAYRRDDDAVFLIGGASATVIKEIMDEIVVATADTRSLWLFHDMRGEDIPIDKFTDFAVNNVYIGAFSRGDAEKLLHYWLVEGGAADRLFIEDVDTVVKKAVEESVAQWSEWGSDEYFSLVRLAVSIAKTGDGREFMEQIAQRWRRMAEKDVFSVAPTLVFHAANLAANLRGVELWRKHSGIIMRMFMKSLPSSFYASNTIYWNDEWGFKSCHPVFDEATALIPGVVERASRAIAFILNLPAPRSRGLDTALEVALRHAERSGLLERLGVDTPITLEA